MDEMTLEIQKKECGSVTEKKCPKCNQDGVFDIYEIIGGCEGEVTKIHCPMCGHIFDPRIHWSEKP